MKKNWEEVTSERLNARKMSELLSKKDVDDSYELWLRRNFSHVYEENHIVFLLKRIDELRSFQK
jgi:hypothetical protein